MSGPEVVLEILVELVIALVIFALVVTICGLIAYTLLLVLGVSADSVAPFWCGMAMATVLLIVAVVSSKVFKRPGT